MSQPPPQVQYATIGYTNPVLKMATKKKAQSVVLSQMPPEIIVVAVPQKANWKIQTGYRFVS
jgi:hypothetical protein